MKHGDIRTVILPSNDSVECYYLGRGRHATAYRASFANWVYLVVHDDGEYMKDAVANWAHDIPHVPRIIYLGERQQRGRHQRYYQMPYYETIRAVHKEAWAILKTLTRSWGDLSSWGKRASKYARNLPINGLYFFNDIIEDTRGKVPESVSAALTELMDAGSNYGAGVTCEFRKRNIGVDQEGRIVFRDILFDAAKLDREMRALRARNFSHLLLP
jgi:hypothetical protein